MAGVLITGFEPFGGEAVNPSWEVVKRLDGAIIAGQPVVARQLPCVFGDALTALNAALDELKPVLTLAIGQAGGRVDITVERVAINVDDARIPDNKGLQPIDVPIVAGGPAAYFSTLPIKAIVTALRSKGIPASVSQTAGTFVCNHVMYGLLHSLRHRSGAKGGFYPYTVFAGAGRGSPRRSEYGGRHGACGAGNGYRRCPAAGRGRESRRRRNALTQG
ncbi:pyrrolidone-carboxylate peptidase [Klebsiella grimontii]|uniref:Pyroglutamyl-peptidase I n=1 Tax=Klebsiella grimontii TaxID=2058152 RepID=A0A7H4P7Q5_9ENTR|nr:pyrrolidone-carboxylate peptidase [Klebsiella grimontii]